MPTPKKPTTKRKPKEANASSILATIDKLKGVEEVDFILVDKSTIDALRKCLNEQD